MIFARPLTSPQLTPGIDNAGSGASHGLSNNKLLSLYKILILSHARHVFLVLSIGYLSYVLLNNSLLVERTHALAMSYVAVLSWAIFYYGGLFSKETLFSRRLYLRRIAMAWLTVTAITLSIGLTFDIAKLFSATWVRYWFIATLAILMTERLAFMLFVRRWRSQGHIHQRAIVVGTGENGRRLIAHLQDLDDMPTTVVGFVDDRKREFVPTVANLPVLGTIHDLIALIRANQVDMVIVALPMAAAQRVSAIVARLKSFPVDIMLAPDLATFEFPASRLQQVAGVPMIHVFERPISGWSHAAKRSEDIVVALAGLLFFSPVMLLAALAVKLTSDGPILFRQQRYGFNNSIIKVLKFRTMYVAASDALGTTQAVKKDPRVTWIGRYLRHSSIDELPQLINVLKGEMSIVGPRPHALGTRAAGHLFEDVVDEYAARHRVRPGMTGWAQIHGLRGEADTIDKLRRRVEFDLHYIENWSVWFDVVIILRTLPSLFSKNAY